MVVKEHIDSWLPVENEIWRLCRPGTALEQTAWSLAFTVVLEIGGRDLYDPNSNREYSAPAAF